MCEVGRSTHELVPLHVRHSLETSPVSVILAGLQVLTPWAAADAGCRPWRVSCLFIAYSSLQPQSPTLHVVHGVCVVCLCGWTTLFTEPPNSQLRRTSLLPSWTSSLWRNEHGRGSEGVGSSIRQCSIHICTPRALF